jgi:hypothetical protein
LIGLRNWPIFGARAGFAISWRAREAIGMSDLEHAIRRRAYELWEDAGCPEGRSDEFWHAARAELKDDREKRGVRVGELGPPIEEPPEIGFQHGIPVGLPGERIVEQGSSTTGSNKW